MSVSQPAGDPPLIVGSAEALRRFPVGATSADETVLVGREGWLFLVRDSNDFVRQYRGRLPLSASALDGWEALVAHQQAEASRLRIGLAGLVIPEKLAVYAAHCPARLDASGPRPAQTLADRLGHAIDYPTAALQDAAGHADVFLRTDPHVSPAGAAVVYAGVMARFGLEVPPGLDGLDHRSLTVCGDLGRVFDPALHEIAGIPPAGPSVEFVADAERGPATEGGHGGLRRLTRNRDAAHDGRLLIFGGSSTFLQPGASGTVGDLLSRTFREVHFVWSPFGWDGDLVRAIGPDLVLLQTTERYVGSVPAAG